MKSEQIVMEGDLLEWFASFTSVDLSHKSVFSTICDL